MKKAFYLAGLAALALGCSTHEDAAKPLKSHTQAIYHGSRTPTVVSMTDGQLLALGWLHSLSRPVSSYCSGTIIAPRLVATAKHCFDENSRAVSIGFSVGQLREEPVHTFTLNTFLLHETRDVALLVLAEDATEVVPGLTPIPFNRTAMTRADEGRMVQAAGYGRTDNGATGRFFAEVKLTGVTDEMIIVDGMGRQGICSGDSGGPALLMQSGELAVVAVETEGSSSCVGQDSMTRLDQVAEWIDSVDPENVILTDCEAIGPKGRCVGNVALWCETTGVMPYRCADWGQICGYDERKDRYYCIDKPNNCGDVPEEGRCSETGVEWCEDGEVMTENCAESELVCHFDEQLGYYCAMPCSEEESVCEDLIWRSCKEGFWTSQDCAASEKLCLADMGCVTEEEYEDAALADALVPDAELEDADSEDADSEDAELLDADLEDAEPVEDAEFLQDAAKQDAAVVPDAAKQDAAVVPDASEDSDSGGSDGCSALPQSGGPAWLWAGLGLLAIAPGRRLRKK